MRRMMKFIHLLCVCASLLLLLLLSSSSFTICTQAASNDEEYEYNNKVITLSDGLLEQQQQGTLAPTSADIKLPIDLFLVIDQSGSIALQNQQCIARSGKNCWTLFTEFAENLTYTLAEPAGGFADTSVEGAGLRLTLLSFTCNDGVPRNFVWLDGPSGNETRVREAFTNLKADKPRLGTCPSDSLEQVRTEIANSVSKDENRVRGVVFLTDGLIDEERNQRQKAAIAADGIRAQPDTTSFAIAIKQNKPDDQKLQTSQLTRFVGAENAEKNIFPIEDIATLTNVSETLIASLANDFQSRLDIAPLQQKARAFGGNGTQICNGASPSFLLGGKSLPYVRGKPLRCFFIVTGLNQTYSGAELISDARLSANGRTGSCSMPQSFSVEFGSRVNLTIQVFDQTAGRFRSVGTPREHIIPRISCSSTFLSPAASARCLIGGNNLVGSFSGDSVAELVGANRTQFQPTCLFVRGGNESAVIVPATVKSQSVECELSSAFDLTELLRLRAPPSPISRIILLADDSNVETEIQKLPSTPALTVASIENVPTASSTLCVTNLGVSVSESCWYSSLDVVNGPKVFLAGSSLESLKNQSLSSLQCAFTLQGLTEYTNLTFANETFSCSIPPLVLKTNQGVEVNRNFQVGVSFQTSNGVRTSLSSSFQNTIKVNNCISVVPTPKKCLLREEVIQVIGQGVLQLRRPSCRFVDTRVSRNVTVPATISGNIVNCTVPASTGPNSGLFFDTMFLVDNNETVYSTNGITFGAEKCFSSNAINTASCWGGLNSSALPTIRISGESLPVLSGQNVSVVLKSDSVLSVPIVATLVGGVFVIPIPQQFVSNKVGSVKIDISIFANGNLYHAAPDLFVTLDVKGCLTGSEIFAYPTPAKPANAPSCFPLCCFRNTTDVEVLGVGAGSLNGTDACGFFTGAGSERVKGKIITSSSNSSRSICSGPGWTPQRPRFNGLDVNVKVAQTLYKISTIGLNASSADQFCFEVNTPKTARLGQPLTATIQGISIWALKAFATSQDKAVSSFINCVLVDKNGVEDGKQLPVVFNETLGTLSCTRPGAFTSEEISSKAMRVSFNPSPQTSASAFQKHEEIGRRQLQLGSNLIKLVDDISFNVTLENSFVFTSASVSCVLPAQTANRYEVVISEAEFATEEFGKFTCSFSDGLTSTTGVASPIVNGISVCSLETSAFSHFTNFSSSFVPLSGPVLNITSGVLNTTSACFLASLAPTFTSSPTTLSPTTSTPTSTPSIQIVAATPAPSNGDDDGGLSGGAIAGIIIGILCLLILLALLLLLKKKKKRDETPPVTEKPDIEAAIIEDEKAMFSVGDRVEAQSMNLSESDEAIQAIEDESKDENNNKSWAAGVVTAVSRSPDGAVIYEVKYDDEERKLGKDLPSSSVRAISYKVGDSVEVLSKEKPGFWEPATIKSVQGKDLFEVSMSPEKTEAGVVGVKRIRPRPVPIVTILGDAAGDDLKSKYQVGDIVEALSKSSWLSKGTWNRAKIDAANADGTFDITFLETASITSATKDTQVPESRIRLPATPFFNVDDHVEYFHDGDWKDGVVSKIHSDNLYTITNSHDQAQHGSISGANIRWPKYAVGDSVKVLVKKNGAWVPAEVIYVNSEASTVDVKFEDGAVEKRVPFSRLRKYASEEEISDALADALAAGFRPPPREHEGPDGPDALAENLRYQRKAPLAVKILHGNRFSITVNKSNGLGVTLGWTKSGTVVVNNFKDLKNGDWGPLEACGLVGLRDEVLAVNGVATDNLSFAAVSELIKNSPAIITITFGRATEEKLSVTIQ